MLFYKDISQYYEKIFPLNMDTVKFLQEEFLERINILDLACGDGKYSYSILDSYRQVTGIDLDEGMLEEANKNKKTENISFIKEDILNLSKIIKKNTFDGVFCIGNSLVHLTSVDKIKTLLHEIYTVLDRNGKFIVQIINYDRIIDKNLDFLPTIKNDDVEFIRNYHKTGKDRIIDFHTVLKTSKGDTESHQELYMIKKDELIMYAKEEKLNIKEVYSTFKKEDWNENSLQSIFVFMK